MHIDIQLTSCWLFWCPLIYWLKVVTIRSERKEIIDEEKGWWWSLVVKNWTHQYSVSGRKLLIQGKVGLKHHKIIRKKIYSRKLSPIFPKSFELWIASNADSSSSSKALCSRWAMWKKRSTLHPFFEIHFYYRLYFCYILILPD